MNDNGNNNEKKFSKLGREYLKAWVGTFQVGVFDGGGGGGRGSPGESLNGGNFPGESFPDTKKNICEELYIQKGPSPLPVFPL